MAAHCPVPQGTLSIAPRSHLEDSGSLAVFPPMPVFRPADTLSKPLLVATRVKQKKSAELAKQVGLWWRARVVNPYRQGVLARELDPEKDILPEIQVDYWALTTLVELQRQGYIKIGG